MTAENKLQAPTIHPEAICSCDWRTSDGKLHHEINPGRYASGLFEEWKSDPCIVWIQISDQVTSQTYFEYKQ